MRKAKGMRKARAWKRGRTLCLALWCALLVLCPHALGQEARAVRVAFFPMEGYHIRQADGSYGGMDVEYLNAVCLHAGWKTEYVECASWEEALRLLSERRVDLVGSAQYSPSRGEEYLYADLASGYTFGVIATNADGTLAYEDFQAMRDCVFGMVRGYVRSSEFRQYMADNGVPDPAVREYETTARLQQALADGEIDALVHTFTEIRKGQRLVGRFAPQPFYYITWRGNEELLSELNHAIAHLKLEQPSLEMELMNRFYYDRFDRLTLLTTEEKAYLKEKGTLAVGYVAGHYPFSYLHFDDGQFRGMCRDILEEGLSGMEVELSYQRVQNEREAKQALLDGEIDLLLYCTGSADALAAEGLRMANKYADVPLVLVMRAQQNISDLRTAAVSSSLEQEALGETGVSDIAVRITASQRESLQSVVDGEADAAVCDTYLAEDLIRTQQRFEDLQIKAVLSTEHPICVAVRGDNAPLARVLSKALHPIETREILKYMMRENAYPLNIKGFVREHSVTLLTILLALVVLAGVIIFLIARDKRKIQKLMYKDTALDIWNMNYLLYWGGKKLLPQKKSYAVVCLHMLHFRRFNSIYGWSAGDRLLGDVARSLKAEIDKGNEICARDRGNHFVLLLCYQDREALLSRLQGMLRRIQGCILESTGNHLHIKMGVYFLPRGSMDLKEAVSHADRALEAGENRHSSEILAYNDQLDQAIKERHEREKLLDAVDPRKDFVNFYQAKVDVTTGRVVGAEALVRFLNPAKGGELTSPGFFVPYYEQTGKITEIDFAVCETACSMLRRRLDAGKPVVPISCNFSRLHFFKPDFVERLEAVITRYRIPRELIEMEITETLILEEMHQGMVINTLRELDKRQIRVAIDDFGSGYSSLGVFARVPASVVKLDRSFMTELAEHTRQVAILRGIVKLVDELKAQVVCEGVETETDVALMREIGATVAQGFFYAKPVPEDAFERRLDEQKKTNKKHVQTA